MKKQIIVIILASLLFSCTKRPNIKVYPIQANFRFGHKFYSLNLNKAGEAYVIKGIGTSYIEPLQYKFGDTSQTFKLDSVSTFLKKIELLRSHPLSDLSSFDAPRVEIFYDKQKIYDATRWDHQFWDMFRPLMQQLPKGYNPFRLDDKPW